ncbi:GNAT family N-acetyltransferase [Nocardioides rubriscoriae]|uniref:GNAT family N-acetyltransferase n=1 Tax=Nocardioides rubriscoriae TaxID=642762 RepID=UPI0011DF7B59|nr:GNAT family N-acetyltransferase [Nocardioides rubriscoriae]
MTLVRAAGVDDAAAWAAVVAAATPYLVVSEASVRHETETEQRTLARLVAEVDGVVVGIARVRDHGHRTMLMVQVAPEHRRRGVGGALLAAALPRAASTGAGEVAGIVAGDDASQAAARAWGFAPVRRHTISAVDPRLVEAAGDGVPLDGLDPTAVHDCLVACAGDDPSGLSQAHALEEFLREDWRLPTHRPDLGRAVVDTEGRVLAFAMVTVAGARAWNAFTGTRPDHRDQGLALRVKTAALVALAGAGVTRCSTGNDAANAPVLAVNARLGYRPMAWTTSASRPL